MILIILTILLVIVIGLIGYLFYKKDNDSDKKTNITVICKTIECKKFDVVYTYDNVTPKEALEYVKCPECGENRIIG